MGLLTSRRTHPTSSHGPSPGPFAEKLLGSGLCLGGYGPAAGEGGSDSGDEVQHVVEKYIREVQPPPEDILEMGYVFGALAHPRRRYLIYSLLSDTKRLLGELATKLVAWERDIGEEAHTEFDRDEMFTSLYHAHVPKLVDLNIIQYNDGEEYPLVAGDHAVPMLAALEGLGASVDTAQEAHARSDYGEG